MVPAMERVSRPPARLRWLGLTLAVGLVAPGCAKLSWFKKPQDPPTLGRLSETTDIYAMTRKPGPAGMAATALASTATTASASPERADLDEVKMAVRPAEVAPDPTASGVALQAPTAIENRAAARPSAASQGVPNASLVLASAGRRDTSIPSTSPAEVIAEARSALDAMSNYEVSVHRQERASGTLLPEEDVVLAIRREPRAVRLTWIDGPNQGREVLYRADEPGASMHVKMANPALPRLTLPPESPLVMRNSRHPVTEAGFDSIIEGLENALKAPEAAAISYGGLEAADGLDAPHHCLLRSSPSGERWRIYLDPANHLPSLVQATDANGDLLERYLFRNVRPNLPELASAEAFDPTARWGQPRGLFGRIARSDEGEPSPTPR